MGRLADSEACARCIKWSLFVVNFLILVGGVVVLSVGIWTVVDKAFIERLLRNELFVSSAYVLISAGFVVVLVSWLGCVGASKEVKCLLLTYFALLFLMLVVLLVGGTLGYVFRMQVEHNLRPEMRHTIEEFEPNAGDAADAITSAWDQTQTRLQCCGMSIPMMEGEPWKAWKMNKKVNPRPADMKVPASCCRLLNSTTGETTDCASQNPVDLSSIYTADCFDVGLVFVQHHAAIIGGVAIGIACLMIVGMVFSMSLFRMIE